jgi:heme exporter protein B
VLATLGFVEVGVVLGAMTWSLKGGDVLLRILLFPMLIPVFAQAVHLTGQAFDGASPSLESLAIILAFDLLFLGAGQLLFEQVVKDHDA